MKLIRFEAGNGPELGIFSADEQHVIRISSILKPRNYSDLLQLTAEITEEELERLKSAVYDAGAFPTLNCSQIKLLAPIDRPIHDILCVGVNYKDHLEETKKEVQEFKDPVKPVYFSKRALRIIGPEEAIKSRLDLDPCLDYEVELAVIIGKRGANIPKEEAEDYIFGYSVFNDISSRTLQTQHMQWFRGKSLDTYTAMGPVILHKSALPFPIEVDVISKVNGELRQQSNTKRFLTDIPSLIADLSNGMTLEPGDIIATGTPAGVGMGFQPPKFMKKGDEVICEISPIGTLVNRVE